MIGTIEDSNLAAVRDPAMRTPQVIVVQLLATRRFEGVYIVTLGVDARHDVLDGAVFSRCVQGLKDKKQAPAVLCIELLLHGGQESGGLLQKFQGFVLGAERAGVGRIMVLQTKVGVLLDGVRLDQAPSVLEQIVLFHGLEAYGAASCFGGTGSTRIVPIMPPSSCCRMWQ